MKKINKICLCVFLFLMFIINSKTYAKTYKNNNWIYTEIYRSESKNGYAIQSDISNIKILKPISKNDKNGFMYFTGDSKNFDNDKKYEIEYNLKTDLNEVWIDYQKYNMPKTNTFLDTNKYNMLMWLIDNMYVGDGSTESIKEYLSKINDKYGININNNSSKTNKIILSKEDIDAVQQLAVWHFTQTETKNDVKDFSNILITNAATSGKYDLLSNMQEKYESMKALYEFFITRADGKYVTSNSKLLKSNNIVLANFYKYTNTTIDVVRDNDQYSYVAGPYILMDNNQNIEYFVNTFDCEAEIIDEEKRNITNDVTLMKRNENGYFELIKDNEGNVITDKVQIIEKLKKENTSFYVAVSKDITKLKQLNLNIGVKYNAREAIYHSAENPEDTDSPIIEVKNAVEYQEYKNSSILELTTETDFSLIQFISAINGTEIKDADGKYLREPKIDLSNLNKQIDGKRVTTANYNQNKDIIQVTVGDIVTYTIRVYNEGGIDGYASEITDYLPPYLEYVNDEENSSNGWIIQNYNDLRVLKTTKLSRDPTDESGNQQFRIIKAFDGMNINYRELKLKCKVINPNAVDNLTTNLRNIENNATVNTNQTENTDQANQTNRNVDITNIENPYGRGDESLYQDATNEEIAAMLNEINSEQIENTVEENTVTQENTQPQQQNTQTQNTQNQEQSNENKVEYIKITNVAEITDIQDVYGNSDILIDRDSSKNNFVLPSDKELPNYMDEKLRNPNEIYIGQEDDDDFEKVQLKSFDLSLRQFCTKVNDKDITSRDIKIDKRNLNNGSATTATYNHSKQPIRADLNNVIILTIRVYNEGEIKGYCEEITEHIPQQFEFDRDNEINIKYKWYQAENGIVKTSYLAKQNGTENILNDYTGNDLPYKDVQIALKVVKSYPMYKKITCIAEITKMADENGNEINDRDSIASNLVEPSDWQSYRDDRIFNAYVNGQEDDDDFEKFVIGEFDLSLKAFVSKINNQEIDTRTPRVELKNLNSSTNAEYIKPDSALVVNDGDELEYTIRIYNEGDVSGYVNKIADKISKGLDYLPENETNKKYKWKMHDENINETENLDNVSVLISDYLSKENGEAIMNENSTIARNPNLINNYEENRDLSYVELKLVLKANKSKAEANDISSFIQISGTSDENGEPIDDRDATTSIWIDGDDDQDVEQIRIQYFNLKIYEKLEETVIEQDGLKSVIKNENDSDTININVNNKDIDYININFNYKIIVKNEGTIAGYVKELKDYIPDGLEFIAEENTTWIQKEDGTVVTDEAKDILIEPGNSIEFGITLKWKNGSNNLKAQSNTVEISESYNDFGSEDIIEDDSTQMTVVIENKNNNTIKYIIIGVIALGLVALVIILIKKFVL